MFAPQSPKCYHEPSRAHRRYGGEEFAFLLPMTDRETALTVLAERIRSAMLPPIETDKGPVSVTVSVGVAGSDEQMAYEAALSRRPSVFIRAATNVQINEAGTR